MARATRALWAAVLAALFVLGGVAAATAEVSTPTPMPDGAGIVYAGSITSVATDVDGVTHPADPKLVSFTVQCDDGTCTFAQTEGVYYLTSLTWPAGQESAATHLAGSTTSCSTGLPPDGDLALTIGAAEFTAVFTAPTPGWEDCDGTQTYRWAQVVTFTGTYQSGETCMLEAAGCPTPEPTATATATATPIAAPVLDPQPASAGSSFLDSGDAAAPSVLSSLATPAEAGTAPSQLLVAAILTVILALLVAFPTALLNSAVESGSERLAEWRAARRGTAPGASAPRSWWWAAGGVAAASVISAFVDPQFGFNPGSWRVVLSILVSFAIDVVLGWSVTIWLVKRVAPESTHSYLFRPLTLLVVVAAVVFTRVTGFEPGIVFGLVAGVAFGALVGRAREARASLVTLGYAFALALAAWLLYGAIGGGTAAGDSFGGTFLIETLSAVAIGGMAALPIALVPLRGLAGHAIWAWSRWAWAGCYAVGLLAFFVVLLPMPFSWEDVSLTLGSWVGLYVVYAAAAVAAWLAISRPWARHAEPAEHAEPSDQAGSSVLLAPDAAAAAEHAAQD